MNLPFTKEEFFNVFEQYNTGVWPVHLLLYALAVCILFFVYRQGKYSNRIISSGLALLWIWMGVVYQLGYFSNINKAAYLFGILFIIQGLLFFKEGVISEKVIYRYPTTLSFVAGVSMVVYSLLLYPLLSYYFDHRYPAMPEFGLPCPTTIFTLGILAAAEKKKAYIIYTIPVLWSFIGGSASLLLDVKEDIGLLVSGVLFLVIVISKRK